MEVKEQENNNNLTLDSEKDDKVSDIETEMVKDDLWAAEDAPLVEDNEEKCVDEDKIIAEKSQSLNIKRPFFSNKGRNLKQMNRTDNFRRNIIRRRSDDEKLSPGEDNLLETTKALVDDATQMLSENESNEALENSPAHSSSKSFSNTNRDSLDSDFGTSISLEKYLEGDITIQNSNVDDVDGPNASSSATLATEDNTDNISEVSSVDTENGINDSITNMDHLKSYLYNITLTCATMLWGYVTSGAQYVFNTYFATKGTANQIEGSTQGKWDVDAGKDEADDATKTPVLSEKDKKRIFNIVNELLSTEKEYVKRLGILVKIKAKTSTILQPEVARSMFQNIEVIHQFHHDNLLPQIEKRILSWEDNPKIGDIMRNLAPFLKLYTEYVKNFTSANELFETWKQKSGTFATFVVEAENNIEYGRLKVQAHMLEPVQRVPRYELLLKDYLKKIPEESQDRADSEEALKLVANAAKHFEEMMKRDSRILELMRLQSHFEGTFNIVAANREFIHQGKVKLVNIKAGKISDRVLHLFNDILLISGEQRYLVPGMADKFRIRHTFYLNNTKVVYGNNLEIPFTFYVKSQEQTVELTVSSADERKLWLDKIMRQIQCCLSKDTSDGDLQSYNETSVEDGFLLQRYTFQLSSDAKSWKKRCLSLYDNGLLAVSRNNTDKQPMSSVHVSNFQVSLGNSQQKKGKILMLVGESKTYLLFDENQDFVDSWYHAINALGSKYGEDESSLDEWAVIQDQKNSRMSTISNDSGVDTISVSSMQSNIST